MDKPPPPPPMILLSTECVVNPLPHMLILGSSNLTVKSMMMSNIWTNGDTISDLVENIVGKEEIAR